VGGGGAGQALPHVDLRAGECAVERQEGQP
jgi:hypothetical protein